MVLRIGLPIEVIIVEIIELPAICKLVFKSVTNETIASFILVLSVDRFLLADLNQVTNLPIIVFTNCANKAITAARSDEEPIRKASSF